jgi:hypothetical protein
MRSSSSVKTPGSLSMVVQLSPIVDKLSAQALQVASEGRRWRVAGERAALQVAPRLLRVPEHAAGQHMRSVDHPHSSSAAGNRDQDVMKVASKPTLAAPTGLPAIRFLCVCCGTRVRVCLPPKDGIAAKDQLATRPSQKPTLGSGMGVCRSSRSSRLWVAHRPSRQCNKCRPPARRQLAGRRSGPLFPTRHAYCVT